MSEVPTNRKIIVTGASGQLGMSFAKIADKYPRYDFVFFGRVDLDISDREQCEAIIGQVAPAVIINCAAYTSVDKAESEPQIASAINVDAVRTLAEISKKIGAILVHYSSDYVYDSQQDGRMAEEAPTRPKSVYAQSKLGGEKMIAEVDVSAIVIRTSWVYSEYGNNFLKTMLRLGRSRDTLSVVADQVGAPTYAPDIATTTMKMIDQVHGGQVVLDRPLLVNYAGEGQVSWYEFAKFIFDCEGIDIALSAISTEEYPTPASRPRWSVLDMTKIKSIFGIAPQYWKASIKYCLSELGLETKNKDV